MKRGFLFLGIILAWAFVVSASVDVHNVTYETSYYEGDYFEGEMNVTLENVDFDLELTSSEDSLILLGDFLDENGAAYDCDPYDCSNGYDEDSGETSKIIYVDEDEPSYFGFYIEGEDISISDISFSFLSDFSGGLSEPLKLSFFENSYNWSFSEFSDDFSSILLTGCFDSDETLSKGPLIRSSVYCEVIDIPKTDKLIVGANVSGTDEYNLEMLVYSEGVSTSHGSCSFDPGTTNYCTIYSDEDYFESGEYYVCVGAEDESTDYRLYTEDEDDTCGFTYGDEPEDSTKDYAIFAQPAKYKGSEDLDLDDLSFNDLTEYADLFILEKYDQNCEAGCVLPVEISGVSQDFEISDLVLDYVASGEDEVEDEIYDLELIPALVDFEGILDLYLASFEVVESGDFVIYFGNKKIIDTSLDVTPVPKVTSLSPLNVPAGVPIPYTASVSYDGDEIGFTYYWDFGDNTSEQQTFNESITHTFSEVGSFNVSVEIITEEGISNNKEFLVNASSPEEVIEVTLEGKEDALKDATLDINSLTGWYKNDLREILNITGISEELSAIRQEFNRSSTDDDYVSVAKALYALRVPSAVYISETSEFPLLTTASDIFPDVIDSYTGEDTSSYDGYDDAILRWESDNVDSMISSELLSADFFGGVSASVFRVYNTQIDSNAEESSYFVLNVDLDDVYTSGSSALNDVGSSSLLAVGAGEKKILDFYVLGSEEVSMFVSPALSSLIVNPVIDTTCNFNGVCEESNGENSSTCRADCKPVGMMVFLLVVVIVLVLAIYTFLQEWYKRNYEGHLFSDRRQVYNLLMFVNNSRSNGKTDFEIGDMLKKKGWSAERVSYILKKSRGETVGMFEIIPVGAITAWIHKRKAKKKATSSVPPVATRPQQQRGANFNKSGFQGGNR